MNEHIDEQLSSLMDGELERDQARFVLRRASTDAALPVRWERYHVARQVLRRQDLVVLRHGFADAVMARIEAETAVRPRAGSQWLRWGAGGAIAASVAVAALVVTRPAAVPGEGPALAAAARSTALPGPTIAAAPAAASTAPAVSALPEVRPPLLLPNAPADASPVSFGGDGGQVVVLDPRLQSYLVRHYQSVGTGGQAGFVPYVLLATPQKSAEAVQPAAVGTQDR